MLNGIEAQTLVVKAGGPAWRRAKDWGLGRGLLSPDDEGILGVCSFVPEKLPTDRQCLRAVVVLRRLQTEGYKGGPTIGAGS